MINFIFRDVFQFHKGTIRTRYPGSGCTHHLDFNSIKVQLEHPLPFILASGSLPFQFHKGTIRTAACCSHGMATPISIP